MKLRVAKWDGTKDGNELTPNGLIRINPNKPEFGSIMLINTGISLSGGFANKKTKVGFVVGRVEELEEMIVEYKLKEGTDFSVAVEPHKIVVTELLESDVPEDRGFTPKINPETKEQLTHGGEAIFRRTDVVLESEVETRDILLAHDTEGVDASKQEFVGQAQGSK